MLTRAPMHPKESLDNNLRWPALVVALFLAGILGALLIDQWHADEVDPAAPIRTAQITDAIFTKYIIPFEVVGVLLLGALIGAVVLARKD
jgi:NADH:ubiquinone oxidoreductase subunit 6 (subunit J)